MIRPVISVIVPVYNRERTIRRCLDSILDQTFKNIEIIVINDKSTDQTLKILKEYKNDIILIDNKKNLGVSASRNKGLKIAKGKYIAFVDSDDYLSENMYEIMYNHIKCGFDMAYCTSYYKVINGHAYEQKRNLNHYTFNISNNVWDKLFKKSIIDKYKLSFLLNCNNGEDINFVAKYFYYIKNIAYVDVPLYYYMFESFNSLDNSYGSNLNAIDSIYDLLLFSSDKEDFKQIAFNAFERVYLYSISRFKKYDDIKLQKEISKKYIKLLNQHFPSYKKMLDTCGNGENKFYRSNYFLMIIYIYHMALKKKLKLIGSGK